MEPMVVGADGLFISVLILLVMLIAVVATIAICKWQMTKTLGLIMFLLYVIFVAQDLMREFHVYRLIVDKHKNHIYMIEEDQNVENDIDRKSTLNHLLSTRITY